MGQEGEIGPRGTLRGEGGKGCPTSLWGDMQAVSPGQEHAQQEGTNGHGPVQIPEATAVQNARHAGGSGHAHHRKAQQLLSQWSRPTAGRDQRFGAVRGRFSAGQLLQEICGSGSLFQKQTK